MEKYPIPNAPGYFITKTGNVFSASKKGELTPKMKQPNTYFILEYYVEGKRKRKYIHRILAEVFLPRVPGKDFVNHIDGNKTNNELSNLEWCTHKENLSHARDTGLLSDRAIYGTFHGKVKLQESDVIEVRKSQDSLRALAKRYGVSAHTIYCAKKGRTWKHLNDANQS